MAQHLLLSKGNLENIKRYYMMMLNDAWRGWGQKLSLSGAGYSAFCWVNCQKKHCSKLISHTTVIWRELPCPSPVPGLLLTEDAAALSSWDLFSTTGTFILSGSTALFVKTALSPELKQKQQKSFSSKVGVFPARDGIAVGVQAGWWGTQGVSRKVSPGSSFCKKCNKISAAC